MQDEKHPTVLRQIRDCLQISPEVITRGTQISADHYRKVEKEIRHPSPHMAREVLRGINAMLSEEKRRKLYESGLLPAGQLQFTLDDLHLQIYYRPGEEQHGDKRDARSRTEYGQRI